MFSLFGHKEERKVLAVIEIGTGSVSATLTRLDRNGPPHILSYERVALPLRSERSTKTLSADIVKALPPLIRGLQKKAALHTEGSRVSPQKIRQLAVVFSAPWSDVRLRTLRLSRNDSFRMHQGVVERMLADEARASGKVSLEDGLIEKTVVGLRLNGYPVRVLAPTRVKSTEVSLLLSHANVELLSKVRAVLEEVIPQPSYSFHSSTLASYLGLSTAFPHEENALFIHVGGEVTELLLLKQGALHAVGSFPQGYNLVLRTLQTASIPPHEAESALKLSLSDTSRLKGALAKTLAGAALDWRTSLRETLMGLSPEGVIPRSIMLAVSGNTGPWFKDALEDESFLGVATGNAARVRLLAPKEFLKRAVLVNETPDPIALLTAIFADARFDEDATIDFLSTRGALGIPSRGLLKA